VGTSLKLLFLQMVWLVRNSDQRMMKCHYLSSRYEKCTMVFLLNTEEVTSNIPESVKVYNGDVLFSWSASLEVMLWAYGLGGLNQHIFKVTSANDFPKSFYYFQLLDYVDVFKKMAEARKTTMGHITQDHLQQSTIAIPDNKDIADKFEELISPIFKQIVKLQEEISNFIKQRDELLPLLMNGQITIE